MVSYQAKLPQGVLTFVHQHQCNELLISSVPASPFTEIGRVLESTSLFISYGDSHLQQGLVILQLNMDR